MKNVINVNTKSYADLTLGEDIENADKIKLHFTNITDSSSEVYIYRGMEFANHIEFSNKKFYANLVPANPTINTNMVADSDNYVYCGDKAYNFNNGNLYKEITLPASGKVIPGKYGNLMLASSAAYYGTQGQFSAISGYPCSRYFGGCASTDGYKFYFTARTSSTGTTNFLFRYDITTQQFGQVMEIAAEFGAIRFCFQLGETLYGYVNGSVYVVPVSGGIPQKITTPVGASDLFYFEKDDIFVITPSDGTNKIYVSASCSPSRPASDWNERELPFPMSTIYPNLAYCKNEGRYYITSGGYGLYSSANLTDWTLEVEPSGTTFQDSNVVADDNYVYFVDQGDVVNFYTCKTAPEREQDVLIDPSKGITHFEYNTKGFVHIIEDDTRQASEIELERKTSDIFTFASVGVGDG